MTILRLTETLTGVHGDSSIQYYITMHVTSDVLESNKT